MVPFQAVSADAAFAAMITADVLRALSGLETWLSVRTVLAPIGTPAEMRRLHECREARYILRGGVEAERTMLHILVELTEAGTGRVLWSNRFDKPRSKIAGLREIAVFRIIEVVPATIHQREIDRLTLIPTDAQTSHDLAFRAFGLTMRPVRASFASAAALLEEAAQRADAAPALWFVRTWWHLMAVSQGWSGDPAADMAAATTAADRTDRVDPAARALRAWVRAIAHKDLAMAAGLLDGVIHDAPICSLAWSLKALVLAARGDVTAAVIHAEQSQSMAVMGPERAWRDYVIACCGYLSGQYEWAVRWARSSVTHHPGLAQAFRVLAASLVMLGRLDEAAVAARQLVTVDPGFRLSTWRRRSAWPTEVLDSVAQRLRLAGLPE